ncbi:MAG: mechanosensitive ion channel [Melioribacteraceae bacterium]|nr:mechanosensitive ion channel [Melioribacteraceae bacterium]MCF8264162.1 mechanosensitive ion channel [Melioribacteraceae bacterium]MCF8413934.1 mechanosensitive ion channel [Melioribacteraceae bacterium]MCF8430524.1 mechanosensitive ion channel [Melioribacteraceae bacterium]
METILNWLDTNPEIYNLVKIIGVTILAVISYIVTKQIILRLIKKLVSKTKTKIDDILLHESILVKISFLPPLIIFTQFTYLFPIGSDLMTSIIKATMVLLVLMVIGIFLSRLTEILENIDKLKDKPIKGYIQIVKMVIYLYGIILIVGIFSNQSVLTILGGLSVFTAVLLLIFKDTILSFLASIQISSYDLVRKNDWIEVPKYGIDGDVMEVNLHTIKVRNFDKTITTIPTFRLTEDSFKNWRGMQDAGGRRIKRAVNIDLSSIRFCDGEMVDRFKKIQLIKGYLESKEVEIEKDNSDKKVDPSNEINGRRLTNVGTFRAYIKAYLKSRGDIRDDFTFLIRQLAPGPTGLPIEVYVFTNTINWVKYEEIQSDIFDHILSAVKQFDLKIFQNPTGNDFQKLINK